MEPVTGDHDEHVLSAGALDAKEPSVSEHSDPSTSGPPAPGPHLSGPEVWDAAFWDERYSSQDALWSREPNRHLILEAGGLAPGTALDVGAGEGADAIWLSVRGWKVTAVDLSAVALERAAANALRTGRSVADRIEWLCQDVITWEPPAGAFDLVSAQYMQLPPGPRVGLWEDLAGAVAPGGTLLVVGHHPSDLETTVHRPRPELFFTGDEVVHQLDPDAWEVVTNAAPDRAATDPEGRAVTVHDAVVRARRLR
ncbi:MAG: class I SAM-dependent methyltransferase [Acidimicrobiales bacterium]